MITENAKATGYNVIIGLIEPKEAKVGKIYVMDTNNAVKFKKGVIRSIGHNVNNPDLMVGSEVLFSPDSALELKRESVGEETKSLVLVNNADVLVIL